MVRSDWIPCECCGTSVPSGLLVEAVHFGSRKARCMTCDGALGQLAARGHDTLDEARFAQVARAVQTDLADDSDTQDTLNPIDVLVRRYLAG